MNLALDVFVRILQVEAADPEDGWDTTYDTSLAVGDVQGGRRIDRGSLDFVHLATSRHLGGLFGVCLGRPCDPFCVVSASLCCGSPRALCLCPTCAYRDLHKVELPKEAEKAQLLEV